MFRTRTTTDEQLHFSRGAAREDRPHLQSGKPECDQSVRASQQREDRQENHQADNRCSQERWAPSHRSGGRQGSGRPVGRVHAASTQGRTARNGVQCFLWNSRAGQIHSRPQHPGDDRHPLCGLRPPGALTGVGQGRHQNDPPPTQHTYAGFAVLNGPNDIAPPDLSYPLIVKPKNEAVSFGLKIVNNDEELKETAAVIYNEFQQPVLAEQYIEGREINVGLLGNSPPEALPPVELAFGEEGPAVYSYEDKTGASGRTIGHICPAPIGEELALRAEDLARKANSSPIGAGQMCPMVRPETPVLSSYEYTVGPSSP